MIGEDAGVANHVEGRRMDERDEFCEELAEGHVDVETLAGEMEENATVGEPLDSIVGERRSEPVVCEPFERLRSRQATVLAACRGTQIVPLHVGSHSPGRIGAG